jgi:hypothetical protein
MKIADNLRPPVHPSVTAVEVSGARPLCHPDPDFLYVAPSMTACAAFSKESRMRFANANKLHRKSGEAKPRDLQFALMAKRNPEAILPRHFRFARK